MKVKCLVVEDEVEAQDLLKDYISNMPVLNLVKVCDNTVDAFETLKKEKIQILFLDNVLPGKLKGLEIIRNLSNPPMTIITTAFIEYAAETYDIDAPIIGYLLKPFSYEKFFKVVNKALDKIDRKDPIIIASDNNAIDPFIWIKHDHDWWKVNYKEILLVEANDDYVNIHIKLLNDKSKTTTYKILVTHSSLKNFENEYLDPKLFTRIHNSYIIPNNRVKKITELALIMDFEDIIIEYNRSDEKLLCESNHLPIGPKFKEKVLKNLGLSRL